MSYSIVKRRLPLAGMDPLTCLSRGGTPMPTPVPWSYGVDVDCQLPGEPPEAAACRSYGGMWYRELGTCIPGALPGVPAFPATPYAPAPSSDPLDQAAAQVCAATGGIYANRGCSYPSLNVTRTRSQLVDPDYDPPAGWTPLADGCPQGQVGWPPLCVPVPNTLPPATNTTTACPAGQVWDQAAARCINAAQLPPGGEAESEKQVAPATEEEEKLPGWVWPAVAGGAAFVILAALVVRGSGGMRANAKLTKSALDNAVWDAIVAEGYGWDAIARAKDGKISKSVMVRRVSTASIAILKAEHMSSRAGYESLSRSLHRKWQKLHDAAYRAL